MEHDNDSLIWAREDVVVTSTQQPDLADRTYYVKNNETGEIFEFGGKEFQIWQEFKGGCSFEAAEAAVRARLGDDVCENLRVFVAELAMRGLLHGDIPAELEEEFAQHQRARQLRLRFQIEADGSDPPMPYYRFLLFDPNAPFAVLARWFGFLKYLVWPIAMASVLAVLIMVKQAHEFSIDFPPRVLSWYGIPHGLFTLLTINLVRVVVMGAVLRHYGARLRFFSLDLRMGVWPRLHVDKRSMLKLERTPQLWTHSSPLFVRLFFFSMGVFGWWGFRGNGTILSPICLLLSQVALADTAVSVQPFFKSESYYWVCAYLNEPYLRERAWDTLRGRVFGTPLDLPPLEKLALTVYGLSIVASGLMVVYFVVNLATGLTGHYRGVGLAIFLGILTLFGIWAVTTHERRQARKLARMERRASRRALRRGAAPVAALPDE